MNDDSEVLKNQVLMALCDNVDEEKNVSSIAKILNEKSYKISRVLSALEQEGLVDKKSRASSETDRDWQKED
ncbi:MAG: ArsR family transcriptional regulator [Butyribacter sp.]